MSYDCTDAYSDLMHALGVSAPAATAEGQIVSEETTRALAEIARLQRIARNAPPMKAGIRRIPNKSRQRCEAHARNALEFLRNALDHATQAGACYTAARIRYAISSAKGAVRAAGYRSANAYYTERRERGEI